MRGLTVFPLLLLSGCATLPEGAQCRALDGTPLFPPALAPAVQSDRQAKLAEARTRWERDPDSLEAVVWYGRRTAYLARYREAVAIYTAGLARHPDSPELLRHRGHRFLSLREFARAEADLARAAALLRGQPDAIEPDGLPAPGRPPHSTLHFNVHYHLGLSRYLQGDFAGAGAAYRDCLQVSDNDEARVAVTHWLWSACMRMGDGDAARATVAPIHSGMDVVENRSYHRLCLLYRGELTPDQVPVGEGSSGAAWTYGLGNWQLVRGDRAQAVATFRALVAEGEWAAFGHIAAEVELAQN